MKKAIMLILAIFTLSSCDFQTKKETKEEENNKITIQNFKNSLVEETELIKKEPDSIFNFVNRASTYCHLAVYENNLNYYEMALNDINKAIKLNPKNLDLYCGRAQCNIRLNRLETVCDDLKKSKYLDYYLLDEAPGELKEKYCK